jgi:hypothetical protein
MNGSENNKLKKSEENTKKNGETGRHITRAVILLFVLPVFNYFILSFVLEYIAGDIMYRTAYVILYYVTEAFSFVLNYICLGFVISSVIRYGVRGCRFTVAAGYIALLIPYIGAMLTELILSTYFYENILYYLAYTALNYILLDAGILTAVILSAVLFKKKLKKRNPLTAALVLCTLILFTVGLVQEIILTVEFIRALLYEYYAPITAGELVSLITSYLMLAVQAAAGYAVMRLTAVYAVNK